MKVFFRHISLIKQSLHQHNFSFIASSDEKIQFILFKKLNFKQLPSKKNGDSNNHQQNFYLFLFFY